MITLLSRKLGSRRKTMASKVDRNEPNGNQETQKKQALKPDLDSDALYRRAQELSTELKRESVVENCSEKVERIKAEIANGTYKVDAETIAEKLLECDFIQQNHKKG